ncbi:hypothetical protein Q4578_18000 [Shimia thalassica]|uniref:hypothetical protein n=1 Tax=Shimia thalassica TaxID=1715693 RepID=UPI0026E1B1CF|nr:hypothetical protein [Shimia thalassica]MDO6523493.1 hypothetical protein [Shimia thalassica]
MDEGFPEIPSNLSRLQEEFSEKLEFVYCANTGPHRKLLPYLYRHWGESRLVVTADDDTIYPNNWLEQLAEAYDKFRCVIAYRGHRMLVWNGKLAPYRKWMTSRIEENPSQLILPTGKDGILYDTAFFPPNVLNIEDALMLTPTADDLWFRYHLALNRIPVFVLNTDYRTSLEEADYETSLYLNFNRQGGNDKAIALLDDYFEKKFDFSITV